MQPKPTQQHLPPFRLATSRTSAKEHIVSVHILSTYTAL